MKAFVTILLGFALWLGLSAAAVAPTEAMRLADSTADMASDMRADIRRQLGAGKTKAEIRADLSGRYGDYVLFRPQLKAQTLILWLSPFLVLILGAVALYGLTRVHKHQANTPDISEPAFSEMEREKIKRLTGKDL
jgi:cytochrome c-type biogenesis protein CcmH